MRSFPNEATMERAEKSGDVIRGGSIGLNRILNYFVEQSEPHPRPAFHAILVSAYTVWRNVRGTYQDASMAELEQAFVKDISLLCEYYDVYLSATRTAFTDGKKAIVLVYFPNYHQVPADIQMEDNKTKAELNASYAQFLKRAAGADAMVKDLENCSCFWVRAGDATYPHKEVARKLRDMSHHSKSLYHQGDAIAMISHIPLDFYIGSRLRGVSIFQSYTGELKPLDTIRLRLDKDGHIPFLPVTHVLFGDGIMIKPMAGLKLRRELKERAIKDRWLSRAAEDVFNAILKISQIPAKDLRKFDFV